MVDLAENPRSSLGGPTDQQGIHPGLLDDFPGLLRRIDVAIGEHRYRHGLLDRRDGLVLRLPGVQVGAGPAMYRKSLDPRLFGEPRDADAVTVVPVPAGPDLQGDRYVDRPDHGIEDLGDQRLVPQQGGPRCLVAYLLRRAAHVDVDDLRTEFHIALSGLGQHGRIAAGDLHRARLVLAIVDQAQARLAAVPQADVAGHHLRSYSWKTSGTCAWRSARAGGRSGPAATGEVFPVTPGNGSSGCSSPPSDPGRGCPATRGSVPAVAFPFVRPARRRGTRRA